MDFTVRGVDGSELDGVEDADDESAVVSMCVVGELDLDVFGV